MQFAQQVCKQHSISFEDGFWQPLLQWASAQDKKLEEPACLKLLQHAFPAEFTAVSQEVKSLREQLVEHAQGHDKCRLQIAKDDKAYVNGLTADMARLAKLWALQQPSAAGSSRTAYDKQTPVLLAPGEPSMLTLAA